MSRECQMSLVRCLHKFHFNLRMITALGGGSENGKLQQRGRKRDIVRAYQHLLTSSLSKPIYPSTYILRARSRQSCLNA